ncbi:gonadotropin-releasing hormone receptor-like [Palaemon carinicauda]|uniref:gonadotropin-releasing hormone receptor-like n=1 Tax=Palaemon carinicauda TaxID=392227 RepID=UPI0035B5D9FA
MKQQLESLPSILSTLSSFPSNLRRKPKDFEGFHGFKDSEDYYGGFQGPDGQFQDLQQPAEYYDFQRHLQHGSSPSNFVPVSGYDLEHVDAIPEEELTDLTTSYSISSSSEGYLNGSEAFLNESLLTRVMPKEMVFNESHIITITIYSCLMVLSALGNISVLRSIASHRRRTSASRVSLMIMHLTIADLLVTFLLMPLEIGWAWTVSWEAGDLACRIMAFFRTFGVFLSGFLLVVISIDRYHAVLRPLTVTEAKRRVRVMLWMAWAASVAFSTPQMFIFHVETHPEFPWFEQCVTFNSFPSPTYELVYIVAGFVAMYALPLTTIVICYGSIVIVLYRKDVISRDPEDERRAPSLGRAKTRTLHMTLIIVMVFFLCWTPYNIMSLWYFIDRKSAQRVDPRVQAALFIFAVANSTVNPLVYGYFNVRRGSKSQSMKQNWRMKRIVYKPPFRQHMRGCLCNHVRSSSSDLPCHNMYPPERHILRGPRYPLHADNHYPDI